MPEEKIRQRYQRLWALVARAMATADSTHVYDSSPHPRPVVVAQLTAGTAVGEVRWPPWTPVELADVWPST